MQFIDVHVDVNVDRYNILIVSIMFYALGNEENVLALPDSVQESLLSKSCDSKEIVVQLKGSLQLDQASLEQPSPETKRWIRCLASKARCLNRRDVVEHLREITPAGTTG